jgi:hypothetical protein
MKVINVSLILAAIAATAGAQQGKTISFGPVPGVAAGSTVPLDSAQFVFIGPNFGQLTISYPSVLGGTQSADRITFVVRKLDQVVPVVSSSVAAGTAAGSYSYTYMIGNSSPAGDQIKVWSLAVPATDAVDSASHSSWTTSQETAAGSPAAGLVGITPVALASWHAPAGGAIAASSAVSGFHVTSRYRPGLTFIYARSGEDYALPAPLPAQVSSQLDVMRQRDWMNKRVVGIGPRFPSDWTRDIIAADFIRRHRSSDSNGRPRRLFCLRDYAQWIARRGHQHTRGFHSVRASRRVGRDPVRKEHRKCNLDQSSITRSGASRSPFWWARGSEAGLRSVKLIFPEKWGVCQSGRARRRQSVNSPTLSFFAKLPGKL